MQPILQANNPFYSFWACFTPKIAILKRSKNGKNGPFGSYFRSTPPLGYPNGHIHPNHIHKQNNPFYTVFEPDFHDAQHYDAAPHPATGLFWSRLSALETHANVFSTHLWSFWYQIHLNQTLLSILKLQKYLQRDWWAGWLGTHFVMISGDSV